ncbi:hydrogenase maturation nickel metallochaperone HypA [Campylobacter sp. VicNov18]|uniref:hydrogenase maturation nickel metallochaperone HypA/HybF n=1 Tax=Campylobacter bilis TaxID=2691918 RepID=UPI00130DFFD0|nr:hydrogenase maturation nickel metallochaperone HypA [Campylobacter bilis]MPV63427.1 hydrogenase maturation nickel metallochaperone HypA [Campylobacter hepaticus]MBM0636926.1 hydrogenase maturation nickel metallochaperone HypA [Campylobacter bilis]MCC8277638.1 hydrogenase maturation nickel metallochaperone HypA [Campylobacter bilis]MCC8299247.1 hydrogenase maturation nickel metallochaperone HypA [Campylobacter bilis]MCC8300547.1 hydrogenase maturation nickel metallochaperone HypA [Campylobac
MHELSIVESLIELCEEHVLANGAKSVQEIYVKIGRLSGIEEDLFKRCFETFKENSSFCKSARLFIELAPLEILCLTCDKTSVLKENIFKCMHCGSLEYKITQGEDLHLMRLVME